MNFLDIFDPDAKAGAPVKFAKKEAQFFGKACVQLVNAVTSVPLECDAQAVFNYWTAD